MNRYGSRAKASCVYNMDMSDNPHKLPDAFVTTGGAGEIKEVLDKVKASEWPPEKWKAMLGIYRKIAPLRNTNDVAQEHAKKLEGEHYKLSKESKSLTDAIEEYEDMLRPVRDDYKAYQLKYLLRYVKRVVPSKRDLDDMDTEELKNFFEGDWGVLKWFKKEVADTEQRISRLNNSTTMLRIERDVELEIQSSYLTELERGKIEVDSLYFRYVTLGKK